MISRTCGVSYLTKHTPGRSLCLPDTLCISFSPPDCYVSGWIPGRLLEWHVPCCYWCVISSFMALIADMYYEYPIACAYLSHLVSSCQKQRVCRLFLLPVARCDVRPVPRPTCILLEASNRRFRRLTWIGTWQHVQSRMLGECWLQPGSFLCPKVLGF